MKQETDDDLRALTNLLDASFANTAKKILIKHGYVDNLGFYEIVAYISRITVNNGKHSWQRIFQTFDDLEYRNKLQELLSSGAFEVALSTSPEPDFENHSNEPNDLVKALLHLLDQTAGQSVPRDTMVIGDPGTYPIGARAVLENIILEKENNDVIIFPDLGRDLNEFKKAVSETEFKRQTLVLPSPYKTKITE